MKFLDFIIVRGQHGFEDGKEINPIEIKIENNKIQNIFDRFEKNKIRFKLNGILFASSLKITLKKYFYKQLYYPVQNMHLLMISINK